MTNSSQKPLTGQIQEIPLSPADWGKFATIFTNQTGDANARGALGSDATTRTAASGTRAWITKHDVLSPESTLPGYTPVLADGRNIALVPTLKDDGKLLLRVEIWDSSGDGYNTPGGTITTSAKVIERYVSNGGYLLINLNDDTSGVTDKVYAVSASF